MTSESDTYDSSGSGSGSEDDPGLGIQPYQREPMLAGGAANQHVAIQDDDFIPDLQHFFERLARIRETFW
jgi:hypothetical protein